MSREYCPRNLKKILPFVGSRVLVIHTRSDLFSMRFGGRIRVNADRLKAYLIKHVPRCSDCLLDYESFLDRQRIGKENIKDVDAKYLGVLN